MRNADLALAIQDRIMAAARLTTGERTVAARLAELWASGEKEARPRIEWHRKKDGGTYYAVMIRRADKSIEECYRGPDEVVPKDQLKPCEHDAALRVTFDSNGVQCRRCGKVRFQDEVTRDWSEWEFK